MRLPKIVKGIVFDVDGTLYNQRRLRLTMGLYLASECLRKPRTGVRSIRFLLAYRKAQEQLRSEPGAIGIGERQMEIACKHTGLAVQEGRDIVDRSFNKAPLARLPGCIRPGLTGFLQGARARGMRLGVFSDYPAENKLSALAIREYFDVVVSSSDPSIGRLKPHPAGLEHCMASLGLEPAHTVYVGDRIDVDAECARRAGVCAVILGSRTPGDSSYVAVDGFEQLGAMLF